MTEQSLTELDQRIAIIRQNINELIEQAAAYSGAEDENRNADRIEQQQQELSKLIELRAALLSLLARVLEDSIAIGRHKADLQKRMLFCPLSG